jgi:hypothetical protein
MFMTPLILRIYRTISRPLLCVVLLLQSLCTQAQSLPATTNTESFTYTGQIETWIVPDGVYSLTIEARGAEGSTDAEAAFDAGKGAIITGTVSVTPGSTLKILAGQQGPNENGGGGGSFVTDNSNVPLVIAGGGGGGSLGYDSEEKHGRATNSGGRGAGGGNSYSGGAGGTEGNGGKSSTYASAGGGLLTNGQDGFFNNGGGRPLSMVGLAVKKTAEKAVLVEEVQV